MVIHTGIKCKHRGNNILGEIKNLVSNFPWTNHGMEKSVWYSWIRAKNNKKINKNFNLKSSNENQGDDNIQMVGYISDIKFDLDFSVEKMNSIAENVIALFRDCSKVSFRANFRGWFCTLSNIYNGAFKIIF